MLYIDTVYKYIDAVCLLTKLADYNLYFSLVSSTVYFVIIWVLSNILFLIVLCMFVCACVVR